MAIKSLLNPDLGIRYKPRFDPMLWRWSVSFVTQCRHSAWQRNSEAKYRLAEYSLYMLNKLQHDTNFDFDVSNEGIVYACRDSGALEDLKRHFNFLQDRGLTLQHLDREALIEKVPALSANAGVYAGAVYSPDCKTGDSAKFSQALARICENSGKCQLEWGVNVERIVMSRKKISSVWTSRGEFKADAYILAAGPQSSFLSRQVGFRLPIYPIKGFSITAPIINDEMAPGPGFDDTERLVAMSKFENRLRISSSAVFDGFDISHQPKDFYAILKLAREVFPDAADYDKAEYWAGLRPMTPSSKPILGLSPVSNLFLNVGHGHLGWTLSCGAGKVVADIVAGTSPDTETSAFQLAGI
jgi:D-amino-acid dehydrogenase